MTHRRTRLISGVASALALALVGLTSTSCSSSSEPEGSKSAARETSPIVPAEFRDGVDVALVTGSLPLADVTEDQKSFQGVDYDLLEAVGEVLGIEFRYTGTSFDNMIPGVQNNRYDLAAAAFYDTEEREAIVDMVTYMSDGAVFVTNEDESPAGLTEETLCGLKVGVNQGGAQAARLPAASDACVADGQDPIDMQVFPTTSAAVLALTSDRIDVYDISASIGLYVASQQEALAVGDPFMVVPVGFVLPQDSELSEAIAEGMNEIIDNGTYAEILDDWGLAAAGIEKSEVNPLTR